MIKQVKQYLREHKPYLFLRDVKDSTRIYLYKYYGAQRRFKTLKPARPSRGNVLISYMNEAFYLKEGQPIPTNHIRYWESLQMAKTFVELGYSVDVYHYLNRQFTPQKDYAVMVDTEDNMERLTPLLDKACVKIFHITTAHPLFNNAAESNRLLALQQRRGVTVPGARFFVKPHFGIEHAHCAITAGNKFTQDTYRYANKPIYQVPVPSTLVRPWPADKNFVSCRKRFLWLGSYGLVHKGLDLVLEAFAGMPDLELVVCGPIDSEPAFSRAYAKELYRTENIRTIEWVDLESESFRDILNNCVGNVFPTAAEGASTSVIDTMHAGLIPIVSYEAGVDVEDFGLLLKASTIGDIQNAVRTIADLPAAELERRARKAWEHARANHTRERFAEEYRSVVQNIITTYGR